MKIRMERAEAETTRAPVAPVSVADLGYAFRSDRIRLEGSPSATRLPFGTDGGWATSIDQALGSFRDAVGAVRSDIAPVALCALPFDRSAPGELVIPHEMIIERGGERWIQTVVGTTNDRDSPLLDSAGVTPPRSLVDPTEIAIRSEIDRDVWCDQIRAIVNVINTTELQKAVLFRTLSIHADRDFVPSAIYRRLSKSISTGYAFLVDGFVGVSPELLVERTGDMVRAHPMAGTLPLSGDVEADAQAARQLISDPKMQVEHQITIDRLHDALLGWCSYLDSEPRPSWWRLPAFSTWPRWSKVDCPIRRPLRWNSPRRYIPPPRSAAGQFRRRSTPLRRSKAASADAPPARSDGSMSMGKGSSPSESGLLRSKDATPRHTPAWVSWAARFPRRSSPRPRRSSARSCPHSSTSSPVSRPLMRPRCPATLEAWPDRIPPPIAAEICPEADGK